MVPLRQHAMVQMVTFRSSDKRPNLQNKTLPETTVPGSFFLVSPGRTSVRNHTYKQSSAPYTLVAIKGAHKTSNANDTEEPQK